MKRLNNFIVLLSCFFISNSYAQGTLNDQLRSLFGNLRKSTNPAPHAPFLWDLSTHITDEKYYTPLSYDTSNYLNWFMLYSEMYQSAYSKTYITDDSTLYSMSQAEINSTEVIPIGVIDMEYNEFNPNALDSFYNGVYFGWNNDTIWDILGAPSPYRMNSKSTPDELFSIFAASPLAENSYFKDVTFSVDPSKYVFYNSSLYNRNVLTHPTPHLFEIDFGDGMGYRAVNPFMTTSINVTYPTMGTKFIKVKVSVDGITIKFSISAFEILSDQTRIMPDQVITTVEGLNVGVFLACGHTAMEKPVIYLEGIDPLENRHIPLIYAQMLSQEKIKMLKNQGYDFVVVDWQNSTIDMRTNADNVIGLIEHLKCTVNNDNQYILIGESMGGVIGRFALTKMETAAFQSGQTFGVNTCKQPRQAHNTRLFVNLDGPQQGAYVPLCVQFLGDAFANVNANARRSMFLVQLMSISANFITTVMLNRPAVKQLLKVHRAAQLITGEFTNHSDRTTFMNDLVAMNPTTGGYPAFCKNISISNGIMNGDHQRDFFNVPLIPNARYVDIAAMYKVKFLHIVNRMPVLDMPSFQLRAIGSGSANVVDVTITKHFFTLRGCLKKFLKPILTTLPFAPFTGGGGACGHTTSTVNFAQVANNPVSWDIMPGGIYPATDPFFALNPRPAHFWKIFDFNMAVDASGTFNMNTKYGIINTNKISVSGFSQIPSFCFIPIQSALDYSALTIPQDHNISGESVTTNNNRTQFNAIVARSFNDPHLTFMNGSNLSTDPSRPRPWINAEIGDFDMFLDNQTMNRRAYCEAQHLLVAGQSEGLSYLYPSHSGIFSMSNSAAKEISYVVSSSNGDVEFKSESEIRLKPGFIAEMGCLFLAHIDNVPDCNLTDAEIPLVWNPSNINKFIKQGPKVDAVDLNFAISVYPNPSTGEVKLEIKQPGNYIVYNQIGQIIKEISITDDNLLVINLENLAIGVYFVKSTSNNTPFKTFIVNY